MNDVTGLRRETIIGSWFDANEKTHRKANRHPILLPVRMSSMTIAMTRLSTSKFVTRIGVDGWDTDFGG